MLRTDEQLVTATLEGDPHAFEEIIRRYERLVFSIAFHYLGRRDEVEDLAQEVFLNLYKSLSKYDTGRPMKAWISRIAANRCLDEMRKARTRKLTLFADLTTEEEDRFDQFYERFQAVDQLSTAQAEDLFQLFQRLMRELADKDRMAFVMRELEGLSYVEIAEALETSELAVRIRVSRSKKKLLQAIESQRGQVGRAKTS